MNTMFSEKEILVNSLHEVKHIIEISNIYMLHPSKYKEVIESIENAINILKNRKKKMNRKYLEPIIIKESDISKVRKTQAPIVKVFKDYKKYSRKTKYRNSYI